MDPLNEIMPPQKETALQGAQGLGAALGVGSILVPGWVLTGALS